MFGSTSSNSRQFQNTPSTAFHYANFASITLSFSHFPLIFEFTCIIFDHRIHFPRSSNSLVSRVRKCHTCEKSQKHTVNLQVVDNWFVLCLNVVTVLIASITILLCFNLMRMNELTLSATLRGSAVNILMLFDDVNYFQMDDDV